MNQVINFKTATINLSKVPFNLTYVILTNKNDNITTLWMVATQWLKAIGYNISNINVIINTHNLQKTSVDDLNLTGISLKYKIANNIKETGVGIRADTILFNETDVKQLMTTSKQSTVQTIDVEAVFEQLHKNWYEKCETTSILGKRTSSLEINETTNVKKKNIESQLSIETTKECTNKLQIQAFKFGSKTVTFRYINNSNGVWFVGKDVANMLEYSDTVNAIKQHVSDYNIQKLDGMVFHHPEFNQSSLLQNHTKLINEAGLYELIIKSKMPKAQEFKKWVVCDVLPSLRKTGQYSMQQASMNDAENLNVINKIVEGSNAAWMEEKLKLYEELREKDRQMHAKDRQLYEKEIQVLKIVQDKNQEIQIKTQETVVALKEKNELQVKLHEIKPLIATRPERVEVFHLLELFQIKPDHGFSFGYFCSRIQERNAPRAKPDEEEEPILIFSIKCANSINAYNCVKEKLRATLSKESYNITGKRFYCNIPNEFIHSYFNNILRI